MNLIPFRVIILFSTIHLHVNAIAVSSMNVSEVRNMLHEVFVEIMDIKQAILAGERSDILQGRTSAVGSNFFHLKKQLSDDLETNSVVNVTIGTYVSFLDMQYSALQVLVMPPAENVVHSIRNHQFAEAKDLLLKMPDRKNRISEIVHGVYDNSYTNIDLILDFAKSLKEDKLSGQVLSSLQYEMHANRHRDPYKLILLAKALEHEGDGMATATNVTIQDIIHITSEIFKTSIYTDNQDSERAVQVEALGRAVDAFNSDVSDQVMKHLINETYGHSTVSAATIADNVYKLKYIPQVIMGLVELFWRLERSRDLNNVAVFKITDFIKQLKQMPTYNNIIIERRLAVERVIDKLPGCVKNLYFAPSICIWNRGQEEPLYAAIGTYGNPIPGKSIFTWIPKGDPGNQGYWYAEKDNYDTFYLRNMHFNRDYLYASLKEYDRNNRFVHAWLRSKWQIELHGEYCYMKSVDLDEYMYVSPAKYDNDRRHVFVHVGKSVKGVDYEWQMTPCTE